MANGGPQVSVVEINSSGSYASIWYADGTVYTTVVKDYRGSGAPSITDGIAPGSTYFYWTNSEFYMYDGTQWVEQFTSGS